MHHPQHFDTHPRKTWHTASDILKMNRKFCTLSDKEEPSSEQVTYCTLCFWICICNREHSSEKLTFFFTEFFSKIRSAKKVCNFLWIYFIAFCFSSVNWNWFHIIGMSQCKIDSLLRTKICNPVPSKNTMHFIGFSTKLLATFMERFVRKGLFQCKSDADSYRISLRSPCRIN